MEQTGTTTRENLMRAFAGECQAQTRYLLAARAASQQQQAVLRQVFELTAKQELIHAELLAKRLSACGVTELRFGADFPPAPAGDLCRMLQESEQAERREADTVYPAFAETAAKEGFAEEAALFRALAEIERSHAERFGLFSGLMQNGQLFCSGEQTVWLCMNCGHLHTGSEPPQSCPVCGAAQGFAVRRVLAPFTDAAD
ncbi:MAG: rubrerythrin family protein [Oscillospiraceae bacterium]|nr:rubrerythrin family protein [Oscillospiraceae bacterium]